VSSEGDDPIHPKRAANPAQPPIYVGDQKLKKLQRTAWEAGWWPEPKKNGIMWLAPDGSGQAMLHGSSSGVDRTHARQFLPGLADEVASAMLSRVGEAVLFGEDACISAA
jgi:hypothetical protein